MRSGATIALFLSFSGKGGVERMMRNLAGGMAAAGHRVDLLTVKAAGPFAAGDLPAGVRRVDLGTAHTLSSLPALARYLRSERPAALLAAKDRANRVAILARRMAGVPTRVVVRMGTTVSASLAEGGRLKRWAWFLAMRRIYPYADGIVAVSSGVAADMVRITGLPPERFTVIPNPVISPALFEMAAAPPDHPWLSEKRLPVVLGVGRLTRQKDFPTLIEAFARIQTAIPSRLVLLGEGRDRKDLEGLAVRLGVADSVDLPGFVDNPYAYLGRADLFVLSSVWEGSPNVLTEAMGLGVPVVAADCPSGPREVLDGGRIAPLVPMGDPAAMADAMAAVLAKPPERSVLQGAVSAFTVDESARAYLELLAPTPAQG
jgi:glycosyltransferase involved in cell wall biosynthesis